MQPRDTPPAAGGTGRGIIAAAAWDPAADKGLPSASARADAGRIADGCGAAAETCRAGRTPDGLSFRGAVPDPGRIIPVCPATKRAGRLAALDPTLRKGALSDRLAAQATSSGQPLMAPHPARQAAREGGIAPVNGTSMRRLITARARRQASGPSFDREGGVPKPSPASQFLPGEPLLARLGAGPWLVPADVTQDLAVAMSAMCVYRQAMPPKTAASMITSRPALREFSPTILPLPPAGAIMTTAPGGAGVPGTSLQSPRGGQVAKAGTRAIPVLRKLIAQEA
ncbi:MAG: hypothetical protein NZN45_03975 [Rhodovarius sp.]|nr:hypothetical protein [Rhodovarius sp.]